jgi:hypothetical protein
LFKRTSQQGKKMDKRENVLSALADSTKFFADLPPALTNFCVQADSAKKYKMVISSQNHKILEFFCLK